MRSPKVHSCSAAHDRNKLSVDQFYGQSTKFTDNDFTTDDAVYWADYSTERFGIGKKVASRITWMRAMDQFSSKTLWGSEGITPKDVRQGIIGDCWFMVAASAMGEQPKRLEKIFFNKKADKFGMYAVNLYTLGVPHTVIVDDFLPLQRVQTDDGRKEYATIFSHVSEDGSLWGAILEKAFAKIHGNYSHLIAGDPREASRALNGSPSIHFSHVEPRVTVDFIWQQLVLHDVNYELMFFNSKSDYDGSDINNCGLTVSHAYVVLAAVELSTGERLVKVRNPVGREKYTCAYSDDSPLWTRSKRVEAGATAEAENEGIFFMSVEDYLEQGVATIISYDTEGWFNGHFLMLNDNTQPNGSWSWCGATCTRHHVQITSEIDQSVYVTAHTWETRSYPKECLKTNKMHSIYRMGDFTVDMFKDGTKQMRPQSMKAGQKYTYILEFDWAREDITPDWSVTAWAENGAVTVEHYDKIQSDTMPVLDKDEWNRQFVQVEDTISSNKQNRKRAVSSRKTPWWRQRNQNALAKREPEKPAPVNLQKILNTYVNDYDLGIIDGECIFKIHELRDPKNDKRVTIGGHGCKDYGLSLQLYLRKADYDKMEKQFRGDKNNGVVQQNVEISCTTGARDLFVMCVYYLAPDNNRIGFLSAGDAGGILNYRTHLVYKR